MPQTDLAATERTIRWWHSDFGGTRRLVRHTYVLCCVEPLSRVQLFATLGTLACQAPLSMGFFRQEYWSGLSFPPPGDPPSPGIEPASPVSPALQEDSLPVEPSIQKNKMKRKMIFPYFTYPFTTWWQYTKVFFKKTTNSYNALKWHEISHDKGCKTISPKCAVFQLEIKVLWLYCRFLRKILSAMCPFSFSPCPFLYLL